MEFLSMYAFFHADCHLLFCYKVLVIREKLAELYESEEQWSKAAQMLSGIDLDSGMRSQSFQPYLPVCLNYYKSAKIWKCLFLILKFILIFFIRVIDDTFRLSKCVQIACLYLEVFTLFCARKSIFDWCRFLDHIGRYNLPQCLNWITYTGSTSLIWI